MHGQYKLVLLDIRWYLVSKGLVCLYILEKVEIWSGVTDAWHTHSHTEDSATQLLSSIKHKLSHAIFLAQLYISSHIERHGVTTLIFIKYTALLTLVLTIDIHESLYNSTKYNDWYQSLCLLLRGADPMRQKGNNVLQHRLQRLLSTPS